MPAFGLEEGLVGSDHPAPPSRRRLASAADTLTRPFAQKRRLADQARLGLGIGGPLGSRLLVVVVVHCIVFISNGRTGRQQVGVGVAQTICSDSVFSFAKPASINARSLRALLASPP